MTWTPQTITSSDKTHHNSPTTCLLQVKQTRWHFGCHNSRFTPVYRLYPWHDSIPDLENHQPKSLPDRPSKKCWLPACGLQQWQHDITHERSSALRVLERSRMINKALGCAAHMDFITFPSVWDASGLLLMDQWG